MDNILYNKTIDLIYNSIISEGGDGDAYWLVKFTTLDHIHELLQEYNIKHNTGWIIDKKEGYTIWGGGQEWCIITDNKEFFNNCPSWIILKIEY